MAYVSYQYIHMTTRITDSKQCNYVLTEFINLHEYINRETKLKERNTCLSNNSVNLYVPSPQF